jgi:hypothetical protein
VASTSRPSPLPRLIGIQQQAYGSSPCFRWLAWSMAYFISGATSASLFCTDLFSPSSIASLAKLFLLSSPLSKHRVHATERIGRYLYAGHSTRRSTPAGSHASDAFGKGPL